MKEERRLIFEQNFIKKGREKWGDLYIYDENLIHYVDQSTPVELVCRQCGKHVFIDPKHNLKFGQGCKECRREKAIANSRRSKEDVIRQIQNVHGDVFDFSESEYVGTHNKIWVTCKKCGHKWEVLPESLINGFGCPKCKAIERGEKQRIYLTISELKDYIKNKFNFDYEFEDDGEKHYIASNDVIKMVCPKHGKFEKEIKYLYNGSGCPICGKERIASVKKMNVEDFDKKFQTLNTNITYRPSTFKNMNTPMEFTCCECGNTFMRQPTTFIHITQECPTCMSKRISLLKRKSQEDFITEVKEKYGEKLNFDKTVYTISSAKVTVTCPIHGDFDIEANSLLQGHGCPRCNPQSLPEEEIRLFLENECGIKCNKTRGALENNLEIDIYIPEKKVGIEFDGLYWHSELYHDKQYHLNKTIEAAKKGIRLIHIFEDEWIYKKDIIKSMLKNILGLTPNKIYARKCVIKEVDSHASKEFLNGNHIQGNCNGKVRIGLYYENKLVSLMVFGSSRHFIGSGKHEWELIRLCSVLNTNVIGGASKMLKYFISKYEPQEIISFADKRWSIGTIYEKLKFVKYNDSKPNYYYVVKNTRKYRYNYRKNILVKKYGCPESMSEREFCFQNKWYRIYDCGCLCFRWIKNNDSQ